MLCSTGTLEYQLDILRWCDLRVLELQLQTYFKSESGHFPFERFYTCADSGQLRKWIKFEYIACRRVSEYLLKCLHMNDCPYANITAAIINLYTACLSGIPIKDILMEISVTLKKPLVNVCDGINYDSHNRAIFKARDENDLIFLKVLVRYGVLRPDKSEIHKHDLDFCLDILKCYLEWTVRPPNRILPETVEEHKNTIANRLILLYEKIESNPKQRNKFLRTKTVIKVLQMLSLEVSISSDAITECLKLYFDATKEPFVSVREIQELIDIPQQLLHLFNEHRMEKGYNHLRSLFPDSDILQPRTLQQLSRCAVRDYLTEWGVLPEVVARLRIPDSMKNYILISQSGS